MANTKNETEQLLVFGLADAPAIAYPKPWFDKRGNLPIYMLRSID
jgi:hypothetical protein